MAKFVVLADLHAHPWAAFAHGEGAQNTRLERTLLVLHASLLKAAELRVPWVFCGDLVHTAGYALNVVLAALTDVLGKYPDVPKLAVWGNHDARGVGGLITLPQTVWATLARAVPNLTMLDPAQCLVVHGGLTFSGAGAQPDMHLVQYAEASDVGVYHGIVRGSVGPNGFVFEHGLDPAELLKRHRIAVVGDLHHAQQIAAPDGQLILIPGSPEHHNFGDCDTHGWWIVTVPEALQWNPEVEFVPSGSPEFLTVETPDLVRPDGNFYRVRRVPAAYELPPHAIAVMSEPTTIVGRDALALGANAEQAVQAWVKEEPPQDDVALYLTAGRLLLAQQDPARLSTMQLTSLSLENFCSYEAADLVVRVGTRLVLGQGRDYPSNGAGKSTLFEAVYWLLFGRTTKGLSGDEVVRWGTDTCTVVGVFHDPVGRRLVAKRTRGQASTLEVDDWTGIWEAASVNEMTEKLTKRLGVTPELFQALAYFSQERLLLFASASDGTRKDMLADLIGLSAYQEASTAAGAKTAEIEKEQLTLAGRRAQAFDEVARGRQALMDLQDASKRWDEEHAQRVAAARVDLTRYDKQIDGRRAAWQEQHVQTIGAKLKERIAERERELEGLATAIESFAGDGEPSPVKKAEQHLAAVQSAYATTYARAAVLKRDAERAAQQYQQFIGKAADFARQLADGACPTCQQEVSKAQQAKCLKPIKEELKAAKQLAEDTVREAQIGVTAAETYQTAVDEAEEALRDARAFADVSAKKDAAWAALTMLQEELASLTAAAKERAELDVEAERDLIVQRVQALEGQENVHAPHARAAKAHLNAREVTLTELTMRDAGLRREAAVYEYWRRGFSKQGLQSLLVEEVAVRFNAMRAEIFPVLTQGVYDVQLSTVSRTKAGEARERTAFVVTEHGKAIPYDALSGGQRRRVDVGVMLTLVMAVAEWMQVPGVLGILVLDEVFGFLDAAGAEGLMDALRAVETRVPAIFVVAHDPQLQALFPQTILVAQSAQGVSSIVGKGAGDVDG